MTLERIDRIPSVDETHHPQIVIRELCRLLNETARTLVDVNNECIELRREVEELKRSSRHGQ